jgi:phosphoglycerol transferase MdoB-like AlkP superfamily enzyme
MSGADMAPMGKRPEAPGVEENMRKTYLFWFWAAVGTSVAAALSIGASQFIWKHAYSCFDECDRGRHNYFDLIISLFGLGVVLALIAFACWAVFTFTRMRHSERTTSER